jgi:hypothetical protein
MFNREPPASAATALAGGSRLNAVELFHPGLRGSWMPALARD